MTKPSILIVTTKLPWPLHGGDRIRIFEQAKALCEHGWDVDLHASVKVEANNDGALVDLKATGVFRYVEVSPQHDIIMKSRAVRSLWTRLPAQVEYFYDPRIEQVVAEKASQYDVLLFHHIRSVKPWLSGVAAPRHAVLDMHDSIARNYEMAAQFKPFPMSMAYQREATLLDRAELMAIKGFSKVMLISSVDRDRLLDGVNFEDSIVRVPISVRESAFEHHSKHNPDGPILFFGRLAYAPNRDAAACLVQEIMPKVWEKFPQKKCVIAGSEPPISVQKICAGDNRVQLLANVPDIYSTIEDASVVVAPIRYGAGMQNKVLESMAIGAPIVGTPFAFEGVGGVPKVHYCVGKGVNEMSADISRLLDSPQEMQLMGDNARRYVRESFGQARWNQIFVTEIEKARVGAEK